MTNVIKKYLEFSQFSNLKDDFEDLFLSHPNYPSLFAISDSLDTLAIENIVVKVPKESLDELPDSFVTLSDNELVLVTKTKHNIRIENEKGIKKNLSFHDFLILWDQIVIVIESDVVKKVINKKINLKWLFYSLPFIALISLSALYNPYDQLSVIVLLTSLLGLLVSIFILQEKFGIENEMVSKICNSNLNISCESVIQSSKKLKWISFSDLPFLFFSISTASILINPVTLTKIIGMLSIITIPIVIYSIFLQRYQLKKWCVLCLFVSVIILCQSIFFGFTTTSFLVLSVEAVLGFFFVTVFITSCWFYLKPFLEHKINSDKEALELKRFKRNFTVFKSLSKEVINTAGFELLQGVHFGNKFAQLNLTLILSPSCGHCHTAFQQAMVLVKKFPEKVFLNVLFNVNPENNNNPYKVIVENLLSINSTLPEKIEAAISDWHSKGMTIEEWLTKWQLTEIDNEIKNEMYKQYKWCLQNGFNYTPVKIYNYKLLPKEYNIEELKYFINNFYEPEVDCSESELIEI
jgi:uncharacterized membrane protein